jgi:hypothetical protein
MTDLRDDARLVEEHRDEGARLGVLPENALDDDGATEVGRTFESREEDLGHPSRRELPEHLIASDPVRKHRPKRSTHCYTPDEVVGKAFWPLLVALPLAITLATPAALADEGRAGSPKSRAIALFEQSARAYREGRFQDAVDLLLEARRAKREPVLLYNLGRAYEAMGKQTEAANAYAGYLAEDPRAADRGAIEGRIATLRSQAEQLDRAKNPIAPPPDGTSPASAGAWSAAEERPPPPDPAPEREREEPTVAPWIITGVGLAGIGTGVVLALVASGRHDDAVKESAQVPAQEKQDEAETFATAATIAFIAGGAVSAVGLGWLGIRAFTPAKAGVSLLPGPGAITLRGTF